MADSVTAPPTSPLRYDPSVEHPEKDEAETEAALTETMLSISETTFKDGGHGLRSVHAKSHGLLRGELRVLDGLPPVLAQGLAAKPGTYPVVIRLSTTPGDILDDSVSAPRGMALKVVGVEGLHGPRCHADRGRLGRLARGPEPLRRGRPHQRAAPGRLERGPVSGCGRRPRFQPVAQFGGAPPDRVHHARAQGGVSAVRAVPGRAQRLPDGGATSAG